jgi:heat shock protein HtpX
MASFFDEIARNKLKSIMLLVLFGLLFMGIIFALTLILGVGGLGVYLFFFGAVILYALFTYYYGDRIVLKVSGAKEADPKLYSNLYSIIDGIASAQQIKMPKVYVIDDANPNAFATGRRSKPSIAVTSGLLSMMNRREIEGVIAHEISHVADNDIQVMTISIAFAGIIGVIAALFRGMLIFGFGGGGRRNGDAGLLIIVALIVGLLAPLFALLIRLAISRRREYMADANGARITRDPASLASALKKLQAYSANPASRPVRRANEVTAPMYFSNPFTGKSLSNLFSTHPPLQDRIAKLEQMY